MTVMEAINIILDALNNIEIKGESNIALMVKAIHNLKGIKAYIENQVKKAEEENNDSNDE